MDNKQVIDNFTKGIECKNATGSLSVSKTGDGAYALYSYQTVIAIQVDGKLSWVTKEKYSTTTSRHLNQAIAAFN